MHKNKQYNLKKKRTRRKDLTFQLSKYARFMLNNVVLVQNKEMNKSN